MKHLYCFIKMTTNVPVCDLPDESGCREQWDWGMFSYRVGISFSANNRRLVALLVGWAFVWPHLAWQLASKAVDPLHSEYTNLKADAILAGMWMGLWG